MKAILELVIIDGAECFKVMLNHGKISIIDASDAHLVAPHRWHATQFNGKGTWYAQSAKAGLLHRLLMPGVCLVDHIDRDGLNNRRSNLRPANRAQNGANRPALLKTESGFKGVFPDVNKGRRTGFWRAQITADDKTIYLGRFHSKEEAAAVYNKAAFDRFGEYALLNRVNPLFKDHIVIRCPRRSPHLHSAAKSA